MAQFYLAELGENEIGRRRNLAKMELQCRSMFVRKFICRSTWLTRSKQTLQLWATSSIRHIPQAVKTWQNVLNESHF